MIVDGLDLPDGTELRADVVVVGAGPAGIVTALELAAAGIDVVLLESGRETPDVRAQELADAVLADPELHAPGSMTERRQVGGTSVIWGGRCVPFDPIDFEPREWITDAEWPVRHEELLPWFQRSCDWFRCGRAVFDAAQVPDLPPIVPGMRNGGMRASALERWSLPTDFGHEYAERLRDEPRVRLVTSVTCTEIVCDDGEPRVSHLEARALDGRRLTARGRTYVLACGGLETTRLMLASRGPGGAPVGDHSGHLGRWYMAHVEGGVARVQFATPPAATQYGYGRDVDGVYVRRRLSFSAEHQRERRLPNVVAWLANPDLPDPSHRSGPLSFAYLALASPAGRFFAPDAQRLSLTGHHVPGAPYGESVRGPVRAHLRNLIEDAVPTARFVAGFGFNRFLPRRRAPGFFVSSPDNAYPLQYHGEHLPHRDSRVTLSRDRDRLGMPKLHIDLRFTDDDVDGVVRAHEDWDAQLRELGIGHLGYSSPDVAGEIWRRIGGGFHQAGTTRMSRRPEDGVVDPDLAVHGFRDLHVASSSTFVTSSQANSTFTIVVFATRLADHLRAGRTS